MVSKKEAKKILKKYPHKWYYDRLGPDLFCGVCGCNMEGMEYIAVNVPADEFEKHFNDKAAKNRNKLHKKCGVVISEDGHTLVPRGWFRETVIMEDPDDGVHEMRKYSYPKEWEVSCPNCQMLRQVFSHSHYEPLWITVLEKLRNNIVSVYIRRELFDIQYYIRIWWHTRLFKKWRTWYLNRRVKEVKVL